MDSTRIDNRIGIRASAEQIWEAIENLERWQDWNPFEREVEGHIGFNTPFNYIEAYQDLPEIAVRAQVSDWVPAGKLAWTQKRGFLSLSTRQILLDEVEKGATIVTNSITFGGLRGELFHDKHRAKLRKAMTLLNEKLKATVEG